MQERIITMSDINNWNSQIIEEFRANEGKVGGVYEGGSLLLLTTIGKKSGKPRTVPLGYKPDGDRLIVVASFMGAPKHPDWYLNLVAHPQVTVEVGQETFNALATTVEGEARERLLGQWPLVTDHQAKTTREIPLVALQRVG
ncbi:MAG: nitroreductase family deazaflavin-dependent oxidoreductase [Ktedonobacteraceae bacterium]|nr:nitroreductase family deazaflavin-dependent oxidoreductase [Ktedonobacteraceae bacterium]